MDLQLTLIQSSQLQHNHLPHYSILFFGFLYHFSYCCSSIEYNTIHTIIYTLFANLCVHLQRSLIHIIFSGFCFFFALLHHYFGWFIVFSFFCLVKIFFSPLNQCAFRHFVIYSIF